MQSTSKHQMLTFTARYEVEDSTQEQTPSNNAATVSSIVSVLEMKLG